MQGDIPVCRICRCEGTKEAPLFHPCKCKGSIKYIHQECLESWLKHSHKDHCDICNAPYTFKTVYNPDTPAILPLPMILKSVLIHIRYAVYHLWVILLALLFIAVQVPAFVSGFDKFLNWQLGCYIPYSSYLYGCLFGEEIPGSTLDQAYSDYKLLFSMFFTNTWMDGIFTIISYTVALGAMVLIQSSILGDPGIKKIIRKRIGPEPKMNRLFEILHRQQIQRLNEVLERNRAAEHPGERANDWLVGHAARDEEIPEQEQEHEREQEHEQEHGELEEQHNVEVDPENRLNLDELQRIADDIARQDVDGNSEEEEEEDDEGDNADNIGAHIDNRDDLDLPPVAPVPEANANRNGLFNMKKGPTFIFCIAALLDIAAIAILICLKLIPSITGMAMIGIFDMAVRFGYALLQRGFKSLNISNYIIGAINYIVPKLDLVTLMSWTSKNVAVQKIHDFLAREWINPIIDAYTNTIAWTPTTALLERRLVTYTGYIGIISLILLIMYRMERACNENNPLSGSYRSLYVFLLEMMCILKVFILVMIEWLAFPLFCGYQIEFALVPFFNVNLYTYKVEPPLLGENFSLDPVSTWMIGTFFMYFFAAFVNMTRSSILRKGVLFFIRPSDDPDIRLLHDALMRPFLLKLTHIGMSAVVYALYIHIELTAVTWAVRLLSPIEILPATPRFASIERLGFIALFFIGSLLKKQIIGYWKWVFQYSCSKLRLSSFLLGKDIPSERGHIRYRSIWAHITHINTNPDYSNPILEENTSKFFHENPDIACVFVPDGNYTRVPDNDQVSRNFVKKLFVPVTKDDQLLAPIPPIVNDEEKYNPYGDEEPLNMTTYMVVYRPPRFRNRIFAFLGMLWVFSMLITLFLYGCSVLVGIFTKVNDNLGEYSLNPEWSSSIFRVDIWKTTVALCHLVELPAVYEAIQDAINNDGVGDESSVLTHYLKLTVRIIATVASKIASAYQIRREKIRSILLAILYGITNFIIFAFAIILPAKYFDSFLISHQWSGWKLTSYKVFFDIFLFVSMNYLGGAVVSIGDGIKISFQFRYETIYVGLAIGITLIANSLHYVLTHPNDDLVWVMLPYVGDKSHSLVSLVEYWIDIATSTNGLCHMCCFGMWFTFLLWKLMSNTYLFLKSVNSQLKEKYYSKGKILANVSDDDDTVADDGDAIAEETATN